MKYTLLSLSKAHQHVGTLVQVNGWVYNKRSSGAILFLHIRDGSAFIQATLVKGNVPENVFENASKLSLEASVSVCGTLKEEKRAPGGYEIAVSSLVVFQNPTVEYPIGKKDHGPDFLLEHRHLWLRSPRQWAIQRIRNRIILAISSHLTSEDFIKIDSPIFTPNACEGTTTLFPVAYLPSWSDEDLTKQTISFSKSAGSYDLRHPVVYLTQSGQLYLEAAIASFAKVYDLGPVFRAEKSKTRRHLCEFWMMDAEMAFCDSQENIKSQERLMVAIVKEVLSNCEKELIILSRDSKPLEKAVTGDFPIITHKQAIKLLKKAGSSIKERDDLGASDETILSESFDKPLFITEYPKEVKAFYMKMDPKDSTRVLNNDLLAPEGYGEVIGGSQREDDFETLLSRMKDHGISTQDYGWYLDLRKFGSVVHSGYGLGLERLVAWICKLEHVREAIPFPRLLDRFKP